MESQRGTSFLEILIVVDNDIFINTVKISYFMIHQNVKRIYLIFLFLWYFNSVRERSFLIPGTRAEKKLPRIWQLQPLGSWCMKFIVRLGPGYENLFNNLSRRRRSAKSAEQFFAGWETFQAKIEECNF